MNMNEFFLYPSTVLSEEDQVTISMLENLIANIKAGNVTTIYRSGRVAENNTAELNLNFRGNPNLSLRLRD